ncbi:MAG: DUF1499 domain-containing protein [Pseudomonadota bacterium]
MRVLFVLLLLFAALIAWIRLAPSNPDRWHTDPGTASPGLGRFVVKPEGGDITGPLLSDTPTEALERLDAIALATPRTARLAGDPPEGRVTYITRSRLWGFPDYTTVAAVAVEGGTRLVIHARLRFGQSDLGVNAARVQGWLDALS